LFLFELEFCTIIRGAELDSVFSKDIVNELAVSEGALLGSSKSKFTNSPRDEYAPKQQMEWQAWTGLKVIEPQPKGMVVLVSRL